jgi:hypothetical protein
MLNTAKQYDRILTHAVHCINYRHRFDASGKTRGAMEQLWKAVIAAAAATSITATTASTEQTVIRQYFQPILSDLLRAATDRRYVYHVSL